MSPADPSPRTSEEDEFESGRSLFGRLTDRQALIEERLRTICLCVLAITAMAASLHALRAILIPFTLAIALSYLLQPLIDFLTDAPFSWLAFCCSSASCSLALRRTRLPQSCAVFTAIFLAFAVLGLFGFVVAESVHAFTERSSEYSRNVQRLLSALLGWMDQRGYNEDMRQEKLKELVSKMPVTHLIMSVVESMLSLFENLMLVLLFTVYLLLGSVGAASRRTVNKQVDMQVHTYIKGKVALSLMMGGATSLILYSLHVDLWLVFGVLAFWLNFVPNVGGMIALVLPLPVVLFDPSFTPLRACLALVLPVLVHGLCGHVLEPVLFGHSLALHPVVVLLSLMTWGALWGVVGLILAVPLTAVLRIHLSHIDHPLPSYLSSLLVGSSEEDLSEKRGGGGGYSKLVDVEVASV